MARGMNTRIESLPLIEAALPRRALLARAAAALAVREQRDHDWRTMVLATVDGERRRGAHGGAARGPSRRRSWCSTPTPLAQGGADARHPRARCCCGRRARLAAAAARALQVQTSGWRCRRAGRAEAAARGAGLPVAAAARQPVGRRYSRSAPRASTLPWCTPACCIDWLELHADGHRRARFDAEAQLAAALSGQRPGRGVQRCLSGA
jgi:pyridoxamine 5'-phosphate oxidase